MLRSYVHLPQFRPRCFARMSTYPCYGQGASLVGQPTPVYLLTYLLRCYLGAKLVYPPTTVKAPVLSWYIHLPQFRPRCFAPMSTYLSLGRGASLVCSRTPVKAKVLRSYVHVPPLRPRCFARRSTYPSLLSYLLTYSTYPS